MLEITSSKNPLIKEIKSLYRRKERWKSKLFIIEGIKIIDEAILNKITLRNVIYTDKLLSTNDGMDFFQKIQNLNNIVYVPENIFSEISDTENPQGVIGIAEFKTNDIEDIFNINNPLLLYLDGVQDPGNMGTIIRTGDAFKITGIILGDGCVDPYNPKVIRATMGSIFRIPLYCIKDILPYVSRLIDNNIKIHSTSLEGSIPVYDANFMEGSLIIIGNESKGVDMRLLDISEKLIKIPMPGEAESLNAGVAASIIMYEAMKQRS